MMDKIQKPNNSECYAPFSEPLTIYFVFPSHLGPCGVWRKAKRPLTSTVHTFCYFQFCVPIIVLVGENVFLIQLCTEKKFRKNASALITWK
jgi:hypothetical protein